MFAPLGEEKKTVHMAATVAMPIFYLICVKYMDGIFLFFQLWKYELSKIDSINYLAFQYICLILHFNGFDPTVKWFENHTVHEKFL